MEWVLDYLLLLLMAVAGFPPVLSFLLHVLLLTEVVQLLLIQCLLLLALCLLLAQCPLDRILDWCCLLLGVGVLLVDLLLLLLLELYAGESTAVDTQLRLELHWHVELEGVAVAVGVVAVALVELDFGLAYLLKTAAVLEHLFPMELHLGHVLHSVDMPWMVVLLLHCLDAVEFH